METENGFTGTALRVIEWPLFLKSPPLHGGETGGSAVTVGVFDGVHLGHRELIKRIVGRGPNPTVVTFRENPKKVISSKTYGGDIFTLEQKLAALESLGVSRVILIDFSENFSKIKGKEFLDLLDERGKMVFLAIGSNFRCGYRQDTDACLVREINEKKGIPTEVVPSVKAGDIPVSSSRIRSAIVSGDLALAAALMGRAIELDLTGLEPEGITIPPGRERRTWVYDVRSVHRLVPESGSYPVLVYPGAVRCRMEAENGKVFLPGEAERLEFIVN